MTAIRSGRTSIAVVRLTVVRLAVAFAAAATTASCTDTPGQDDPPQAAARSTVAIEARGCGPQPASGTGAAIGEGVVVTAAHVVAGADTVTVIDPAGNPTGADVVWFDPEQDVAAVRLTDPEALSVSPASSHVEDADDGSPGAIAVVDPDTDEGVVVRHVEVVRSVTIETTDIHRRGAVSRPGYEIAGTIDPGDSGALVHAGRGTIGIIWARSTRRDDRAWVVALPDELTDRGQLAGLVTAVSTGSCVD